LLNLFIIAGEVSGDRLGARLLNDLKTRTPFKATGVAGDALQAAGCTTIFPQEDLSVMGFWEVLQQMRLLKRRITQTVQAVLDAKPDVVLTIDSPGFTLRVAKRLRDAGYQGRLVHYVAPSVWAWKPKRAEKLAALYNQVLCLLPFEPPYFTKHGVQADFVGHSVLQSGFDAGDAAAFRAKHGDKPFLLLLPGSRTGEVKRLLPLFLETAKLLPAYTPIIPTLPHLEPLVHSLAPDTLIVTTQHQDAFAAANGALAASGTVSLELAMAGVPAAIAYKVHPITYQIARRLIKLPFGSLVNILLNREVFPERLQNAATPASLAHAFQQINRLTFKEDCREALLMLKSETTAAETLLGAVPHKNIF
jgi:lipid-A-disaccharide synthase